ncbi:MAG: hypothetical protein JWQ78_1932, partial [Sediminibacterium sp.]|nr:hypothetical protein [Sediminibacterium sp.]
AAGDLGDRWIHCGLTAAFDRTALDDQACLQTQTRNRSVTPFPLCLCVEKILSNKDVYNKDV